MAISRKVTSRVSLPVEAKTPAVETKEKVMKPEVAPEQAEQGVEPVKKSSKKYCSYCVHKNEPHYWDASGLRRFLSDRGRIYNRTRTGTCSKHQRRVAREVKRARGLALLPFTVRA